MIDPFNKISDEEKKEIFKNLEAITLTISKGQSLRSSFKQQKMLGIVVFGQLDILYTNHNGNTYIVNEYCANDIFGSLISNLNHKDIDLVASEDSEVVIFDELSLFQIFSYAPSHQQFLSNMLYLSLQKINEDHLYIEILNQKTIRNRLLMYFSQHKVNKTVTLPYSYKRLADYLAVDRCAMMRELKSLKEEHFIETKGRKITLKF